MDWEKVNFSGIERGRYSILAHEASAVHLNQQFKSRDVIACKLPCQTRNNSAYSNATERKNKK